MERRFVKVEKGLGPQGRIAVVRFDRGDNINALSQEAMRELRDVPRDFEDDLLTSVVILTGGAMAFSAGFDLKDPEGRQRDSLSVAAMFEAFFATSTIDEDTPHHLIAALQPDVLVKGADWAEDAIVGRDVVEARGGRVVRVETEPGYSTGAIIEKIRLL